MTWTQIGTIQVTRDWQYTEPVEGTFFKLRHIEAPNGGLFAIAQCEVDLEGNLSIGDSQVLVVEKGIADVVKLPKSAIVNRRIAIKRLVSQPSLEQEVRRLFLPSFLQPIEPEVDYIRRNNWAVSIEVSDYVEVENTSPTVPVQETQLNYVSSGDTNGTFYHLGTNGKTQAFSNPASTPSIELFGSSTINNTFLPTNLTDRDAATLFYSNNIENSHFGVNLKTYKLLLNAYTLQGSDNSNRHLRTWLLQGSSDNTNWITINSQTNNSTITGANWFYAPIGNQTTAYQYFRIVQTGVNSSGDFNLSAGEWELYGKLIK